MRSTSCEADRTRARDARDSVRGSAVVEFLAVAILVVLALMTLVQLAVWVWARDVAVTAAHEGARTAAERGRDPVEGVRRAQRILHDGLGRGDLRFRVDVAQHGDRVAVRAIGAAPRIVPFLPGFPIDVGADALDEDRVLP